MDWFAPVDLYCERTDAGFWAEPLNACSNVAFLLAALAAASRLRRAPGPDPAAALMIALVVSVGVGSYLFHSFANRWSSLADVIPIAIFIHVYLFFALRRFLGLGPLSSFAGLLAFVLASRALDAALAAVMSPGSVLAGSAAYVPAALAIFTVASLSSPTEIGRERGGLLLTGALFALSLTVRSVDQAICQGFPVGTHWLWHVLNAIVLYRLVAAAIRLGPGRFSTPAPVEIG